MEDNHNHNLNLNHVVNDDRDYDQEGEERSVVGGSRWNPTKEQIEMLERMYGSEGVRTPSAEQIQQITARLRVYGHIEGKNVFYWFQNHKARQRQKLRHDRFLSGLANSSANHNINHIFAPSPHHYHINPSANGINLNTRPFFPAPHPTYCHHLLPPNPNVICSPYYHTPQYPQGNLGFYNPPQHHYSAPLAPDRDHQGMKKRPSKPASINKPMNHQNVRRGGQGVGLPHGSTLSGYCASMMNNSISIDHYHHDYLESSMGMRTLNLFPVHPTGILDHKLCGNSTNNSAAHSCASSSSSDAYMNYKGEHQQHQFINFFSSGHASSESA